jgi:hypothetical protein
LFSGVTFAQQDNGRQRVDGDMQSRQAGERFHKVWLDFAANELGGDFEPDSHRGPARPWPVDPAETRFIGEQDPQATASPVGGPLGFPHSIWKAFF